MRSWALALVVSATVVACVAGARGGRKGDVADGIVDLPPTSGTIKDVPFGINNAFASTAEATDRYLLDLGAPWISDHVQRRKLERGEDKSPDKAYDFAYLDPMLREYGAEFKGKAWFVINVESKYRFEDGREVGEAKKSEGKFIPEGPRSFEAYERFLRALVPYVNRFTPGWRVRYWSVDNEQASLYVPAYCGSASSLNAECGARAAAAYATLVERTSRVLRDLDPQAKIVFGGPGGGTPDEEYELFYKPALTMLREKDPSGNFDCFDFHNFGLSAQYGTNPRDKGLDYFRGFLESAGYPGKCILVKAGATHSGQDLAAQNKRLHALQSETDQAVYLVKRLAYHLGSGVRLILWGEVREDEESHGTYSHNGLVYNGIPKSVDCSSAKETPCPDPGNGIRKLAYYSFKLMVEKLNGMIPEQSAALPTGTDGVFAYRFPRTSGSTWIVWSDVGPRSVPLLLEGVPDGPVTVTEAVPRFSAPFQTQENKLDAARYPAFFTSTTISVVGGKVRLAVGPLPLVIAR